MLDAMSTRSGRPCLVRSPHGPGDDGAQRLALTRPRRPPDEREPPRERRLPRGPLRLVEVDARRLQGGSCSGDVPYYRRGREPGPATGTPRRATPGHVAGARPAGPRRAREAWPRRRAPMGGGRCPAACRGPSSRGSRCPDGSSITSLPEVHEPVPLQLEHAVGVPRLQRDEARRAIKRLHRHVRQPRIGHAARQPCTHVDIVVLDEGVGRLAQEGGFVRGARAYPIEGGRTLNSRDVGASV